MMSENFGTGVWEHSEHPAGSRGRATGTFSKIQVSAMEFKYILLQFRKIVVGVSCANELSLIVDRALAVKWDHSFS